MLESLPLRLLLGTVMGLLSGLGVGGGSLLILWLTMVLHTEPEKARLLNLLFFLPAALIASLFRWKQVGLPLKKLLPGSNLNVAKRHPRTIPIKRPNTAIYAVFLSPIRKFS